MRTKLIIRSEFVFFLRCLSTLLWAEVNLSTKILLSSLGLCTISLDSVSCLFLASVCSSNLLRCWNFLIFFFYYYICSGSQGDLQRNCLCLRNVPIVTTENNRSYKNCKSQPLKIRLSQSNLHLGLSSAVQSLLGKMKTKIKK